MRFQQTSVLLSHSDMPLAQIAVELGYADQSHMTHQFSRFFGQPPARARQHVAFLQDQNLASINTRGS
ncbi:helix-turn-helix domain-containing protein [Aliidiomarina minuta]|uniref:helix-turn-helix domain-containing protein n=1 Tax=Aliidiomarina minuta TaxID=880057 RepID=UPI003B837015